MSRYTTTVREGEKLSDIAKRFTGNTDLWYMIVHENNHLPKVAIKYGNSTIVTLASLTAGQKLFIPGSWVINRGAVSGAISGCGCGNKCNSCSGSCDYPYGNRYSQSAPCGAFGNNLGSCGRMRTDAYLTGTVGVGPTTTTAVPTTTTAVPTSVIDQVREITNLPPDQCVKKFSESYPYIKQQDFYPELVSKIGSEEEVKAIFDIMTQKACNVERKDINGQPFYSKPVNWLWMGGALVAGVIVGKVIL